MFLAVLCSMRDLSSWTRDRTHAPCSGNLESQLLDHLRVLTTGPPAKSLSQHFKGRILNPWLWGSWWVLGSWERQEVMGQVKDGRIRPSSHDGSRCPIMAEWEHGPDTIYKWKTPGFKKLTRRQPNGQQVHEKMLNITNHQRNANQNYSEGFPGGAVVASLPANAGDTGLSPGLGRSHMPRSG